MKNPHVQHPQSFTDEATAQEYLNSLPGITQLRRGDVLKTIWNIRSALSFLDQYAPARNIEDATKRKEARNAVVELESAFHRIQKDTRDQILDITEGTTRKGSGRQNSRGNRAA